MENNIEQYFTGTDIFNMPGYYALVEFLCDDVHFIPCSDGKHVFVPDLAVNKAGE